MDRAQWWQQQLQSSLENFIWAVEQMPAALLFTSRRADRIDRRSAG